MWAIEQVPEAPRQKLGKQLVYILDLPVVQILLMICLFLALFLVDSVQLATSTYDEAAMDAVLVVIMVLFTVEVGINATCRPNYGKVMLVIDLVGTLSMLIDLSPFANQMGAGSAMRAARVGSRAGRLTRLLRVVRLVRVFKIFALVSRLWTRGQNVKEVKSASGVGNKLSESITLQIALLVIATIMIVSLLQLEDFFLGTSEAHLNFLKNFVGMAREDIQVQVDEFLAYIDADIYLSALSLVVGDESWTFASEEKLSQRDILEFKTESGDIVMRNSIRKRNINVAMFNVLLIVCIIGELFVFVALLNHITRVQVVTPLDRIFTTIKNNADQVISALPFDDDDDQEDEAADEINTIEAAIEKMARLVKHVSSGKEQGAQMVSNLMKDKDMDDDTRKWLAAQAGAAAQNLDNEGDKENAAGGKKGGPAGGGGEEGKGARAGGAGGAKVAPRQGGGRKAGGAIAPGTDRAVLHSWNFNVFEMEPPQLREAVIAMFDEAGIFREGLCEVGTAENFLLQVQDHYNPNPYHNFQHAVDVTHTLFRFLSLTASSTQLEPHETFAMLVGAISHDLEHPGVNNAYLEKVKDPLATTYNDKSILENRHIACLYSLLAENPEANVFSNVSEKVWKEMRRIIISVILHTDMSQHFGMVSQLEVFVELHDGDLQEIARGGDVNMLASAEDKSFILQVLLHAADVSNPVKPHAIYDRWASCVLQEFFEQGDREAARGMPISPMMDRSNTQKPISQVNFIEFIVGPLYSHVLKIFPQLSESGYLLLGNSREFMRQHSASIDADASKPLAAKTEEHAKMTARWNKLKENFVHVLLSNPVWAQDIEGDTNRLEEAMKNRRQSRMMPAGVHIPGGAKDGKRGARASVTAPGGLGSIGE